MKAKKIKARDLTFPLSEYKIERSSWFKRWIVRKTCAYLLNGLASYHQFGGYTGSLQKEYHMVDAETEQIVHWLLRSVGYDCCTSDILKVTDNEREDPSWKDITIPRMVLVPESLVPQGLDTKMTQEHIRALV